MYKILCTICYTSLKTLYMYIFVQHILGISNTDFYGPVHRHGGSFTNLLRYNLLDAYSLSTPVYGYINDTRPQPQTFLPDNIAIVSDGFCGSTCAVFAELMKTQAGVQAIAVGVRKQYSPMQWIGGSKGTNDQYMTTIANRIDEAIHLASPAQKARFAPYIRANLLPSIKQMIKRLGAYPTDAVNFHNNIRKGDITATPLQLVYVAADCRLFYTADMLHHQSLVWQRVYDIKWGNATYMKGSTGQPSSVKGFDVSYISSYPPPGANNTFGADEEYSYPGAYSNASQTRSSSTSQTTGGTGCAISGSEVRRKFIKTKRTA